MSIFDGKTRRRAAPAVAMLACAICSLLFAAGAAAAPNWFDPADLSKPGRDATNPAVAMDSAGDTLAIWERQSTANPSITLQTATRAPGAPFVTPVEFPGSPATGSNTEPSEAMTQAGEAVVAWKHFASAPGVYEILVATRPPGGSFGAPVTAYTAEAKVIPQELEVAIGEDGTVAVTWSRVDPGSGLDHLTCGYSEPLHFPVNCRNPPFVEASVRPPGGSFTAAQRISEPRGTAPGPETPLETEEREKAESLRVANGAKPVVDGAGDTTVVWSYFDGADDVVQTAIREAGGSFTPPAQISESGSDASPPAIDGDTAGDATAVWVRTEATDHIVQVASRPRGGSFSAPGAASESGGNFEDPSIDVAPDGAATILWRLNGFSETFLQTVSRPPGGAFEPAVSVNSGKDNPLFGDLATDGAGDTVVAWSGSNGSEQVVRAAVRSPGAAAYATPVAISLTSPDLFHPRVAMDAEGNATVVWVRDDGAHTIVQEAGYDAQPPRLAGLSIPSSGKVGDLLRFSAVASDVWPVAPPRFEFGDGASTQGASVLHAYSAPGRYAVTASATDAAGKTIASTGTLLVKARNFFTIGKLRRNPKKGTGTLTIAFPEPGTFAVTGKGIAKATVEAAKGGSVKVPVKAAGKGRRRLAKRGRLKALLKVEYSPVGGDPSIQRQRVTLRKKPA
jgi:hypothetical protein